MTKTQDEDKQNKKQTRNTIEHEKPINQNTVSNKLFILIGQFYRVWVQKPYSKVYNCKINHIYLALLWSLKIIQLPFIMDLQGVSDCCLTPNEHFVSYIMARTSYIRWDEDDIRFIPDQHA
jgi:hypothetical protein